MPDWTYFPGAIFAGLLAYDLVRRLVPRRRREPASVGVSIVATRGRTLAGSYIVVIEIPADDVAASSDLFAALMSAPPDGSAVPDHIVPLWHRNGGYEA